jgi:hypothetical protein
MSKADVEALQVDAFFEKPFSIYEIRDTIRKWKWYESAIIGA